MELKAYFDIVRKYWLSISILVVLGVTLSFGYTKFQVPNYKSSSQVFVSVSSGMSASEMLQGSSFTVRQVKSYSELATSQLVLGRVTKELGLGLTAEKLATHVNVVAPLDTSFLNISVTDPDAQLAALIANEIASQLTEVVEEIESRGQGASGVVLTQTKEAKPAGSPFSPNLKLNVALGMLVGLALGVLSAIARKSFDLKVRDKEDILSETALPMLAGIQFDEDAPVHPLIIQDSPYTLRSEAFRRLRTNLQFVDTGIGAKAITVISAIPGEGKSTTAMNLAIALADAGSRVIIVDADLRRPTVGKIMGLEEGAGLTNILIGQATIEEVTQNWAHDNLNVITCGVIPPNPSELLGSIAMNRVIEELKEKYDIVIFDSAPLVPVTDGAVLAKLTDGALLVVGAGIVNKSQVKEALDSLNKVGATTLGLVGNRFPVPKGKKNQYGYYYGYTNSELDGKKEPRKSKKKQEKKNQQPVTVDELAKPKAIKPEEPKVLITESGTEGHPWSGETVTGAIPTVTAKTVTKNKEEKKSEQQDFSSLRNPRHAVTKD